MICDLKAKARLEEGVPSDQFGAEFLQQMLLELS